jgi:hypothetical protein
MTLIQGVLAVCWVGLIVLCLHPKLGAQLSIWFRGRDDV